MTRSCQVDQGVIRSLPGRATWLAAAALLCAACSAGGGGERGDGAAVGPLPGVAGSGGAGGSGGAAAVAGQAGAGGTVGPGQAGTGGGTSQAGSSQGGTNGGGAGSTFGGAGTSSGGGGGTSDVPRLGGALKIFPFGDSITASSCYRARLAELLDAEHAGDYEFVGSQQGDSGCGYTYDTSHEGHGGYLITQHTGELAGWASANPTDVVLLHFATNDVWNAVPNETILSAYSQAVDEFRKSNPNVTILVAQIIPLEPNGCGHCDVTPLNQAIPDWAASESTAESPVLVVDQFTGYSAMTDSSDTVHPNDTGSRKMAARWAEALFPLF